MNRGASGLGLADRALEALYAWPALEEFPVDPGAGLGLTDDISHIIHLHQPDEAELYLTWPAIVRLGPAPADLSQVQAIPGDAGSGSAWPKVTAGFDVPP